MKLLAKILVTIAVLSAIFSIYLINKYGLDYIVVIHWALITIPAIYLLSKRKSASNSR